MHYIVYSVQLIKVLLLCFLCRDKVGDLSPEVINALYFLEQLTHYGNLPRKAIERHIPSYLFDEFRHATS